MGAEEEEAHPEAPAPKCRGGARPHLPLLMPATVGSSFLPVLIQVSSAEIHTTLALLTADIPSHPSTSNKSHLHCDIFAWPSRLFLCAPHTN